MMDKGHWSYPKLSVSVCHAVNNSSTQLKTQLKLLYNIYNTTKIFVVSKAW